MTPEQIAALEGLLRYYDKTTSPSEVQGWWRDVARMVKDAKQKAKPPGDDK